MNPDRDLSTQDGKRVEEPSTGEGTTIWYPYRSGTWHARRPDGRPACTYVMDARLPKTGGRAVPPWDRCCWCVGALRTLGIETPNPGPPPASRNPYAQRLSAAKSRALRERARSPGSTRSGQAERRAWRRTYFNNLAGWVRKYHAPAEDGPYTVYIVGPAMDRLFDTFARWVEKGSPEEPVRTAAREVEAAWKAAHHAALSREPPWTARGALR